MAGAEDRRLSSVMLNEDACFVYPDGDWYWTRHIQRGYYEPEIERVLRRAADRPYVFLDAGANFGYWSVLVSSAPYGARPAIAIEASLENFSLLTENAKANGGRFRTLHRAILDVTGRRVDVFGEKHYGMSLRRDWHTEDAGHSESVETITLDEVASAHAADRQHPPILKIDVEGVEIEAIGGARHLIDEGAMIVFEDHGKERSHRISRFVMSLAGLDVWRLAGEDPPVRIATIEQVEAIKQNPKLGYNFFACRRESPWYALFQP